MDAESNPHSSQRMHVTAVFQRTQKRWRERFEATAAGSVWSRSNELGFIESSLQFSATFVLFFIPFLLVVSAAIGRDLPHALVTRDGFSARAAHDVTSLFAHRPAPISWFTLVGVILVMAGADSMAKTLQSWYERVFAKTLDGWKKPARRVLWLAGAAGFVMLQFLIGTRFAGGGAVIVGTAQFISAVGFWWWSVHCLLAGEVPWRRLFATGLATAFFYTGVGLYVRIWTSWTIVSNETNYGPIGSVMTILATLVALGIAIFLGAIIGTELNRLKIIPERWAG